MLQARGIKLDDGRKVPEPLTDEAYPLGYYWFSGDDKERVDSINHIYL